jgi:uncharacterized membrane protein YccF (DUF307 family)
VRVVLNVIWLLLSGIWLALGYLIAAIVMFVLILTIPFGKQALKLAGYALWPFGRVLVPSPSRHVAISVIGNIIWFVLAGWWLALLHLIGGILLCLTIIGIPLGVANFKMAGAALVPFGKEVRSLTEVGQIPSGAVAVGNTREGFGD